MNNLGQNDVNFKLFNKMNEVVHEKTVPLSKFRFMRELERFLKQSELSLDDLDIQKSIDTLNENDLLKIKSIMVVDDEVILRELYSAQISRFCHYVEVFESAIDALDSFQANPLKYDFIISDNIMPEMKGDELADKIKEVKPDIPVYIITGDSDSVDEESFNNSVSGLITKPIDADKLKNFLGEGKVDLFLRDSENITEKNVA